MRGWLCGDVREEPCRQKRQACKGPEVGTCLQISKQTSLARIEEAEEVLQVEGTDCDTPWKRR
jgi:hypothetical protein